jgi:replicative superfamily II helicase
MIVYSGGKTLVGLLIAKAIMNETQQPVVYLCPIIQLVK